MVKKSLLLKKLASYSALATAMLSVEKNVDAQILYTHLNDTICGDEAYNLDLNNDGIVDFIIYDFKLEKGFAQGDSFSIKKWVYLYAENNNAIAYKAFNKDTIVSLFNSGQEIGSTNNFNEIDHRLLIDDKLDFYRNGQEISSIYFGLYDTVGEWKYAGLQLKVNDNTYYGWLRFKVVDSFYYYCVQLKDYALNIQPNASIIAGDTIIPPNTSNSLELYPNPVSGKTGLTVSFQLVNNPPSSIVIYDITGREVRSIDLPNIYTMNTLQIDVADLAAGMYILKFTSPQYEVTKKFVIL